MSLLKFLTTVFLSTAATITAMAQQAEAVTSYLEIYDPDRSHQ